MNLNQKVLILPADAFQSGRKYMTWLLVFLLGLIITEVRLSHGEPTSPSRIPLYWIPDR